jgi:hypothetical protein
MLPAPNVHFREGRRGFCCRTSDLSRHAACLRKARPARVPLVFRLICDSGPAAGRAREHGPILREQPFEPPVGFAQGRQGPHGTGSSCRVSARKRRRRSTGTELLATATRALVVMTALPEEPAHSRQDREWNDDRPEDHKRRRLIARRENQIRRRSAHEVILHRLRCSGLKRAASSLDRRRLTDRRPGCRGRAERRHAPSLKARTFRTSRLV